MSEFNVPPQGKGFNLFESSMPKDWRTWRILVLGLLGLFTLGLLAGLVVYFLIASHYLASWQIEGFYANFWQGLSVFTVRSFTALNMLIASLAVVLILAGIYALYLGLKLLSGYVEASVYNFRQRSGMLAVTTESETEDVSEIFQEAISQGISEGIKTVVDSVKNQKAVESKEEPKALPEPTTGPDIRKLRRSYRRINEPE